MQASAAGITWPQYKLSQLILTGELAGASHLAPGDTTTCAAAWERAILGGLLIMTGRWEHGSPALFRKEPNLRYFIFVLILFPARGSCKLVFLPRVNSHRRHFILTFLPLRMVVVGSIASSCRCATAAAT